LIVISEEEKKQGIWSACYEKFCGRQTFVIACKMTKAGKIIPGTEKIVDCIEFY